MTYPAITDIGGTRIRPENGRLVRQPDGAALYVDLHSTGKYGDVLVAARAPIAGGAMLVGAGGAPVPRLEVPGAALLLFRPGGPNVRLSELTRALTPGEVVIVTLVFEKIGHLGVVSVVE
ncbi:MAG: copper chaperone PCu(A)C [Candidatus Rokubacteria bacterium]|nr:copper chaperone PCu(A)C [Candidatus Rokubacteria bacterium]